MNFYLKLFSGDFFYLRHTLRLLRFSIVILWEIIFFWNIFFTVVRFNCILIFCSIDYFDTGIWIAASNRFPRSFLWHILIQNFLIFDIQISQYSLPVNKSGKYSDLQGINGYQKISIPGLYNKDIFICKMSFPIKSKRSTLL